MWCCGKLVLVLLLCWPQKKKVLQMLVDGGGVMLLSRIPEAKKLWLMPRGKQSTCVVSNVVVWCWTWLHGRSGPMADWIHGRSRSIKVAGCLLHGCLLAAVAVVVLVVPACQQNE